MKNVGHTHGKKSWQPLKSGVKTIMSGQTAGKRLEVFLILPFQKVLFVKFKTEENITKKQERRMGQEKEEGTLKRSTNKKEANAGPAYKRDFLFS